MMSLILFLIIGLLIPIFLILVISFKFKVEFKVFIIGLLTFFISQILFRIPILEYINLTTPFITTSFIYKIILPFTAGLVEVGADYIALKYFIKDLNINKTLVLGVAHCLCENITVGGVLGALNLLYSGNYLNINLYWGSFERLFALIAHVAFALFAYYSIIKEKKFYLFLGILLHGFCDLSISFTNNIYFIEISTAVIAIFSLTLISTILKKER